MLILRNVCYQDEKNRYYEFLTNNLDISSKELALLFKKRWGIEILFKKMKQNFQLHFFYGETKNAIRTQIWYTLFAQLLLTVIQGMARTKKAFSVLTTMVRIHLISLLDMFELISSNSRFFSNNKRQIKSNRQISLFSGWGSVFELSNQTQPL